MSKVLSRVSLLVLVLGFLTGCQYQSALVVDNLPTQEIIIGSTRLVVEVARTTAQKRQGLSGREFLAPGTGMMFVFDQPDEHQFWMKDMNFPLDFLWISSGKVIEIMTNVPAPSIDNPQPAVVSPQQPIDMVIEVPAGWAVQNNVKVGDEVD